MLGRSRVSQIRNDKIIYTETLKEIIPQLIKALQNFLTAAFMQSVGGGPATLKFFPLGTKYWDQTLRAAG